MSKTLIKSMFYQLQNQKQSYLFNKQETLLFF